MKVKQKEKDHRFQIIGLDKSMRAKFLSYCKLNNTTGNKVLKKFMKDYIKTNETP